MIELIDPYELGKEWNPMLCEDNYATYLKCSIWITDGEVIEEWYCYKTTPDQSFMRSGKDPIYWMIKNGDRVPNLPNAKLKQ